MDGLQVGSVWAKIGALFDDDGFDKYRRAMRDVREDAKRDVKPDLSADFNARGFDQFGRALKEARVEGGKDVKPDLGADFNGRGFSQFEKAIRGARSEQDVSTDLKADVDETGFRKYDRALRSARNESDITTRAGVRTGAGFVSVGKSAAGAAVAFLGTYGLVEGVRSLYTAYRESERVSQQTDAVLKSTGESANVTADHVSDLATKFSFLAAEDDEAIQSGENFLLTFTNIQNEVGKGNNIFDRATLAVLNMSVALDQDMKSGAIQLGKALNDPIKGITALSRVGVSFTEETKERITALVEEGDTLSAQKIILKELEKEFGGSAKAAGEGASGFDRLKVSAENLEESIGAKLAPTLSKGASAVADFLDSLAGGKGKSNAGNAIRRITGEVTDALAPFEDEVSGIAGTVGKLFSGIGDVLDEVFGSESGIGADLSKIGNALRDFGQFSLRAYNAVAKRALPGIITAFRGLATIVRGVVRVIAGILTLDFGRAWDGVKDIFSGAIKLIGGTLRGATAPFREAASAVGRVLIHSFEGAWDFIEGIFEKGFDKLLGLFTSGLRTIATVLGASPDLPGIPDPQDASNEINALADSIDGYRESLRKTDDEQKTARQRAREHIAALKDERRELRATDASTDELRRNKRQLREAQADLTKSTREVDRAQDKARGSTRNWADMLQAFTKRGKGATRQTNDFQKVADDQKPFNVFAGGLRRLIKGSGNFQDAFYNATEFIKDASNKALKKFGADEVDWTLTKKDVKQLTGFARGGFIGRRGQKGKDKRLVLAGDGEAFFNGDQIPYVEQALRKTYGVNLNQFFGGRRWRPHSQTRGYERGGVVDRFAYGGWVDPAGPGTGVVNPAIADEVGAWSQRYNAAINYGYDPGGGHLSPGHNVTGTATDTSPAAGWTPAATALFEQGLRAIAGKVDQILYGTAGIGTPYPNHGRGNHAHIEWGMNPGAIGGAAQIPRLKINGPAGPQTEILQGAADQMVKQANAYLARQGSFGIMGDTGGGGSPDANRRLAHSMMLERGRGWGPWGESEWPPLDRLWTSESNFDEHATNPSSGAYGIPQSLPASKMAAAGPDWKDNPATQIKWGLGYIDEVYGAPSNTPLGGYRLGGIVEEFAQGGQVGKAGKKGPTPKLGLAVASPANISVPGMPELENHLGQDGGKFVAHQEGKLAGLEDDYSYWDRRFNLSEEEFIVEGPEGEPILDREAMKRRVKELKKLLGIRKAIIAVRAREIAFAKRTIKLLQPVIKQLKAGLRAAQTESARKKWRAAVEKYTGQLGSWRGQLSGWTRDKRSRILDRDEIAQQLGALGAGGSVEREAEEQLGDFLAGKEDEAATSSEGQASPEEVAKAAAAQLAEFQSQRASLYGEFGSNFVPAGTVPFQTAMQQAAGMSYYGVMGAGSAGAINPMAALQEAVRGEHGHGKVEVKLEQTFQAPPPDPHTWTKSALFDLGAQL